MSSFFEQQVSEKLKNPVYAKAYYLATGEIETVDKIVNYLQNLRDEHLEVNIQWIIDSIIQRKWDPEWTDSD
jgi:hypothetical protein